MADLYRIKDWDELFENNRTRDMKHMNWVPFPTKLDGDGYTELVDRPNGAAIYGCWCACVLIAGRCDPRGTLLRTGLRPHDSSSLARISRLDKESIEEMLELAQEIGWIEVTDTAPSCGIPAPNCPLPSPSPNPNPKDLREDFFSGFDGLDQEDRTAILETAKRISRAVKLKFDSNPHLFASWAHADHTDKIERGSIDDIIDKMAGKQIRNRLKYFETAIQERYDERNGHAD